MTGQEAAEMLGVSLRHTRRLIASYRQAGAPALAHGNRGRPPTNKLDKQVREEIVRLAKAEYLDYNDTHFTEELAERHGIAVSTPTVRRLRRGAGLGSPRKRRVPRHPPDPSCNSFYLESLTSYIPIAWNNIAKDSHPRPSGNSDRNLKKPRYFDFHYHDRRTPGRMLR